MMKNKAFTLTELLISIMIMAILAGVSILNLDNMSSQTAQREAERIAAYIHTHLRRVDITQDTLWISITSENIELKTGRFGDLSRYNEANLVDDPSFKTSTNCTFQGNFHFVYPKESEVNLGSIKFQPIPEGATVEASTATTGTYCITVNGADGKTCNVLIGRP